MLLKRLYILRTDSLETMSRLIVNQPQGSLLVGYPKVTDDPKIPGVTASVPVLTSFALKLAFTEVTGLPIISPTAMTSGELSA